MFDPIDKGFDKNSLQTPRYIFDWLNSYYNFDVDLCASDEHHFCNSYFTKENSCLGQHIGLGYSKAFCNPPYSNIDPFLGLALDEVERGLTTVFLIPELNGEKRTKLIMQEATKVIHLSPRVSFIRPDNGQEYKGNNRGSIVVEISPKIINSHAEHSFFDLNTIKAVKR